MKFKRKNTKEKKEKVKLTWQQKKKNYVFGLVISILFFLLSIFSTPNVSVEELDKATFKLVFEPSYETVIRHRGGNDYEIHLKFYESDKKFKITGIDYQYVDHSNFKADFKRGDLVTIYFSDDKIYDIVKYGKHYMNLEKSNYHRNKNRVWPRTFSIVGFILCLIPVFFKNEPRINFIVILISGLILTFIVLYYTEGLEFVQLKNYK